MTPASNNSVVFTNSSSGNQSTDALNVGSYNTGVGEIGREYILDYGKYRSVLEDCNRTVYTQPYPSDGGLYCSPTWDTMQCWQYTLNGTTATQPCPAYVKFVNPKALARKVCLADGTWYRHPLSGRPHTDYAGCFDDETVEKHKKVLNLYFIGFGTSIVLLTVSLFIFSWFRQLKCTRVTLHKHLFFSYILSGALWIMYYALVPDNSDVLLENPGWCQALHVLTQHFTLCNYAWMFCEGFYLHALIVIAFTKDTKLLRVCYGLGWGFPFIPTIIYTCVRATNAEASVSCWTDDSPLSWIVAGPINVSLVVNLFLAINIMRILLSKLRSVHSEQTQQTWRALRATLILIPLLGLQYLALPFKPDPGTSGEHTFALISAVLVSFQGVFVSLMFCFFNGEVIVVLKRHAKRWSPKGRLRSGSHASKPWERDTMLTGVTKCPPTSNL